jgi:hypothetical protein
MSLLGARVAVAQPGAAAQPAVTITTTPRELTLCPGVGEGQVLVVVRNGSGEPIRKLCVTSFANGPLRGPTLPAGAAAASCPDGLAIDELPAGGTFSKLVTIALTDYPTTSAWAHVWARYQRGAKEPGASEAVTASIEVKAPAPPTGDALKLETKVGFASLHEGEAGKVVLMLGNGTNEKLMVEKLLAIAPADAKVTTAVVAPLAIAPQSTVAVDFTVTAEDKINTGKRIGLIDVDATTSCKVAIHRVASYEVTLGVFGESELLTTIGVPSLLFLPGFLILTLWMLLWRFRWARVHFLAKSGGDDFMVAAKEPEFWLLGFTFSLVLFVLLPRITQIGYRQAYALPDIARLWYVSLGIGLGVYAVLRLVDGILRGIARRELAARTLTERDGVLDALDKLVLRGWSQGSMRRVKLKANPQVRGFQLWSDDEDQSFWVIPQIQCKTKAPVQVGNDPRNTTLGISELRRRLAVLSAEGATVAWADQDAAVGKPRLWKRDDFGDESQGDLIEVQQT